MEGRLIMSQPEIAQNAARLSVFKQDFFCPEGETLGKSYHDTKGEISIAKVCIMVVFKQHASFYPVPNKFF